MLRTHQTTEYQDRLQTLFIINHSNFYKFCKEGKVVKTDQRFKESIQGGKHVNKNLEIFGMNYKTIY